MHTLFIIPDIDCHLLYYLDVRSIMNLASISKAEFKLISNLDFIKEIAIIKKKKITECNIIYYAETYGFLSILKWCNNIIVNLFFNANDTDETIYDKLICLDNSDKKNTIINHNKILQWFIDSGSNFEHSNIDIVLALKNNNIKILELLFKFNFRLGKSPTKLRIRAIVNAVAKSGHIFVLDWLRNAGYEILCTEFFITTISEYGNVNILEWLDNFAYTFECSKLAINKAAKNGHIAILDWFAYNDKKYGFIYTDDAINEAVYNGHIKILEWFDKSEYDFKYSEKAMLWASVMGRIDVLDWFEKSKYGIIFDEGCITYAVTHGHLHVIIWFRKFGYELKFNTLIISKAISNAHMHIVSWIKDTGYEYNEIEISEIMTRRYIYQWLHLNNGAEEINIVELKNIFPTIEIINRSKMTLKIHMSEYQKLNIIQYTDIKKMDFIKQLFWIKNGTYMYFSLRN